MDERRYWAMIEEAWEEIGGHNESREILI